MLHKKLFPSESHSVADFSLQLGEGEVTVAVAGVLTKGSTLLTDSIKMSKNQRFRRCECTTVKGIALP